MSTKYKLKRKRITVQARISKEWYLLIKQKAHEDNTTISKFLDCIFQEYFGKNTWKKIRNQFIDYKK